MVAGSDFGIMFSPSGLNGAGCAAKRRNSGLTVTVADASSYIQVTMRVFRRVR